jgi:hypothetical protein
VNVDFSVAPEIAQLAAPRGEWGGGQLPHARGDSGGSSPLEGHGGLAPHAGVPGVVPRASTVGRLAGELARLAAAPQRWWDLVRFDAGSPVRIPVPGAEGTWLLVLPPGGAADCDCARATLLAGEAAEDAAPLRPGRVRLHGGRVKHRVRGAGHSFSVTLHSKSDYPERTVAPLSGAPISPWA